MADKTLDRRKFLLNLGRGSVLFALGGAASLAFYKNSGSLMVWQIDPDKCTQCGRCADYCVLAVSAVKCYHSHQMCGYCDLCGGYQKPESKTISTAAENQLCPTSAIVRKFVEEPYYEYNIIKELCIGCGKCVKGCTAFGNGSLYLQIDHKICTNCNICSIKKVCPSEAIVQIPQKLAYFKREG